MTTRPSRTRREWPRDPTSLTPCVSTQEEWETAINRGLAKRLKDLEKERERRERASTAADEEFSTEFLGLARKAFQMIDKDDSGTLEKEEILRAVRADQGSARGVLRPRALRLARTPRNCCFRVFGVWWCRIGLQ